MENNKKQTNEIVNQFIDIRRRDPTSQGTLGDVIMRAQKVIAMEQGLLTEANISRLPADQQKVHRERIQILNDRLKELAAAQVALNNGNPQPAPTPGQQKIQKEGTSVQQEIKKKGTQDVVGAQPDQKVKTDDAVAKAEAEKQKAEKDSAAKKAAADNAVLLSPEQIERKRILDGIPLNADLADGRLIELRRGLSVQIQRSPPRITVNNVSWEPRLEQVYEPVTSVGSLFSNVGRSMRGAAVSAATAIGAIQIGTVMRTNEGFRMSGSMLGLSFPRNPATIRPATLEEILPFVQILLDKAASPTQTAEERSFDPVPYIAVPEARKQVQDALGSQRIRIHRLN